MLRAPELDIVVQMGSHQNRIEGRITSLDLLATLLLMQPKIWWIFWAASTHCQLMASFSSTSTPKSFSSGLLSIPSSALPVLILGVAPTQVQDPALGLVEPHEVHVGPFLRLAQAPLDGNPSFWFISCTTQLGVICRLAEGALNPSMSLMKILNSTGPNMDP